jgi:hypothetical protein
MAIDATAAAASLILQQARDPIRAEPTSYDPFKVSTCRFSDEQCHLGASALGTCQGDKVLVTASAIAINVYQLGTFRSESAH